MSLPYAQLGSGSLAHREPPGMGPGFVAVTYVTFCRPTPKPKESALFPVSMICNDKGLCMSSENQGSWGESPLRADPLF